MPQAGPFASVGARTGEEGSPPTRIPASFGSTD